MPKINKNLYEFSVGNVTYRAAFHHEHMRRDGGPIRVGTVKAQHITTCVFGTPERIELGTVAVGMATCSVKDQYNRPYGLRTSFERALLAAGKVNFSYVKERVTSKDGSVRNLSRIVFHSDEDRINYGKFVGALFQSMQSEEYGKAA